MAKFTIKQNDTKPDLCVQLLNADLTPINLTDCNVKFIMSDSKDFVVVEKPCTITDAENGKVCYYWNPLDTKDYGVYKAEFEISFPDVSILTVPNDDYLIINIVKELG